MNVRRCAQLELRTSATRCAIILLIFNQNFKGDFKQKIKICVRNRILQSAIMVGETAAAYSGSAMVQQVLWFDTL